jgi:putative phosphoesterase
MRVAIISDIHGNLTALEAVISDLKNTSPDLVVQGGDLAANGHQAAGVIDRIRELGWAGVQGNTDEMLWTPDKFAELAGRAPKIRNLLDILFHSIAPATRDLIGEERMQWLRMLPRQWRGPDLVLVHASPADLWQAPMPNCDERQLVETYDQCNSRVVAYGHIHRPYVRQLPKFVVANSGSVGMPYDGDPRASYLLIEEGQIIIRRVKYDVASETKRLLASGYPHATWLAQIRRQGHYIPPF